MLVAQQLHNNADVFNIFIFLFKKNTKHISIVVQLLYKSCTNNISLINFPIKFWYFFFFFLPMLCHMELT
jgi:hypothetical protein